MSYGIFPSNCMRTSVVEPYNTVLSTHSLLEHNDLTVFFDNERLYKICADKLGIESPNYKDINTVAADYISSMMASMRFDGTMSLQDLSTQLVPYPRIHFLIPSKVGYSKAGEYQESKAVNELVE